MSTPALHPQLLEVLAAFAQAACPGDSAAVFLPDGGCLIVVCDDTGVTAAPATQDDVVLLLSAGNEVAA